ncbi:hypothetical protein RGQ29_011406 [Quercus rubra]|uniref:Uncharacterized protein n=1 Tax=Quercus rubra TaxID=3512 RepID=A0AAN7FX29_QUERU|nr:hypothetical protein RGQ29_011406 [Quercus rubra]
MELEFGFIRSLVLDASLGCVEDPFPPLSKMMNMKSVGLQVLWIL